MRIACPACAAAYEVPDTLLAPGRRTRCARCGHQWVPLSLDGDLPPPVPLDPHAGDESDAADPEAPPPRRAAPAIPAPAPAGPGWGLRAAWAGSVLLLILLGVAGVIGRQAVMAAWPPATRLYAAIGLAESSPESRPAPPARPGPAQPPAPAPPPASKPH
ncbi:MAG: zinc-ribbon domain-containing protein [Rhodospirillales bacterium]|nr:zinc-ribbon domain-containing protein [Rhodospirillales bacterium]